MHLSKKIKLTMIKYQSICKIAELKFKKVSHATVTYTLRNEHLEIHT